MSQRQPDKIICIGQTRWCSGKRLGWKLVGEGCLGIRSEDRRPVRLTVESCLNNNTA